MARKMTPEEQKSFLYNLGGLEDLGIDPLSPESINQLRLLNGGYNKDVKTEEATEPLKN